MTDPKARWTACYCGGWIKHVFQRQKLRSSYVYKEARWQIVNCFPVKR